MKALRILVLLLALWGQSAGASPAYSLVQGIDKFTGSAAAWHLLETNGFVVADPTYKQIFEPYLDPSLPPFITTDSAWDTYEALVASAGKRLESNEAATAEFFGNARQIKIPNGGALSGLDFLVASPELRSPAATKALRRLSGANFEEAMESVNYSLPSGSLAAKALRVQAKPRETVEGQAGAAFGLEAWADEQVWAQLGGWVGQSAGKGPRTGFSEGYEPAEEAAKYGAVAPYPDIFAGLAELSRATESAMEKAGMDEPFETRMVAQKLLEGIFNSQNPAAESGEEYVKRSNVRIQFDQFVGHSMGQEHAGGGENSPAAQQLTKDLEAVARRCMGGEAPSAEDGKILRSFYDERMTAPRLLAEFAVTCDKLAELAGKQSAGTTFTDDDEKWIAGYGLALARYHLFPDPSAAGEEAAMLRRLGTNQGGDAELWGGLGKPEALYIILPANGRLHLFRGGVMSYREIVRTASSVAKDKPVPAGDVAPPAFTASFRAEKSAGDILATLASEAGGGEGYRDIQDALEALQSRVTDADLPALIRALAMPDSAWPGTTVSSGIGAAIAKLNWLPRQKELFSLIDKDEGVHAAAVASILSQRPEWLDGAVLRDEYEQGPPRSRRVCAFLLGFVRPTEETRAVLLKAMRDEVPSVRWQAAQSAGNATRDTREIIPALLDRLNDTNQWVVSAAARVLGKIGTADIAPILFTNLQQAIAAPGPQPAAVREQRAEMQDFVLGIIGGQPNPFDPEGLLGRAQSARMRRANPDGRREQFNVIAALAEALGELGYQPAADTILGLLNGPNANAAARALKKLAPGKLAERLVAIASDKNAPPQGRDDALVLLSDSGAASPIAGLVPLLDDRTAIPGARMMPGHEWRICDRAAATLAALMGRPANVEPAMPVEERDEQIGQIRQWLKAAY